jgi:branched-chain amino acid transport system ATP-binding protein
MRALAVSNHVYCLQEGRISLAGPSRSLDRDTLRAAYFGV